MKAYGFSHQGYVRENNEDRFLINLISDTTCLLAVADGMGGRAGGEVASQMVMAAVSDFVSHLSLPSEYLLQDTILQANSAIAEKSSRHPELTGMGTTATLAWIAGGTVYWSHVGDSRLYHFRGHSLRQITRDHNLAGTMVEQGIFTAEQARSSWERNMLMQCVGCPECNPDIGRFQIYKAELLLLCTDGLSGGVSPKTINTRLSASADVQDKAESLINDALQAGGKDNVTVIVVEIE